MDKSIQKVYLRMWNMRETSGREVQDEKNNIFLVPINFIDPACL